MATGTVQNVVVCVPRSQTANTSVSPCSTLGGVKYQPAVMSAYLVDPSQASTFDLSAEQLDPASVAQVWMTGFSIVVLFFLIGRGVGSVLSLIRRG